MAVLSFKNNDGNWELFEVPGVVKFSEEQDLSEAEQARARANLGIGSSGGSVDNSRVEQLEAQVAELASQLNGVKELLQRLNEGSED